MPDIISVRAYRRMAPAKMTAEERSELEALRSCRECGAEATWGIVKERVAYCQTHAPWVDHALAGQVSRAVEPLALRHWLQQRPNEWRAKADPRTEEWRGDPVLVQYLDAVVGRTDLAVHAPVVQTLDYRPVTHLPSWTERFSYMLGWWVVGDEGAGRDKVLEVLHKVLELEELAARGPAEAIRAKEREAEVMPPEIMQAALAAYRGIEQQRRRKSLLRRLFGSR